MCKKVRRTRPRSTAGSGGSGAATPKKFTAPTPGLEDVFFTWGTAKDAAKFEDTVSQLVRYPAVEVFLSGLEGRVSDCSARDHGTETSDPEVLDRQQPVNPDEQQVDRGGGCRCRADPSQGRLRARPRHRQFQDRAEGLPGASSGLEGEQGQVLLSGSILLPQGIGTRAPEFHEVGGDGS